MDKERLYDDRLKLQVLNNNLNEENQRMKTRVSILEKELDKRDKFVEESIALTPVAGE